MTKIFTCKLCKIRGTRRYVRLHLRQVHKIKPAEKNIDGKWMPSTITPLCIPENIK